MKNKIKLIAGSLVLLMFIIQANGQKTGNVTIIDSRHYSLAFGEFRNYRIFLPPGYSVNLQKRYPVIYFYHGWAQGYFGSVSEYSDYDKGNENDGDNMENFVSTHDVIVVKHDGYNRSENEEYDSDPYNLKPVETFRQFPIYFPELVNYIDAHYRTIADREHRSIAGLSKGGYMAFWIGGKYPQLVSAVGNFCGSYEFVPGPKDFPVEYRSIDMYQNFGGVNVRLNYGDKDRLRAFHQDLNRIWPQIMDNYEFKVYPAEHSTCGLGEMFGFILKTFENPPQKPLKWDHNDVYPEFSVWGYTVSSDRDVPGFTVLENVDQKGFRCAVRGFLPDGEVFPFVKLTVTTPAIYEKDQLYIINDVDVTSSKTFVDTIRSDNSGKLMISIDGRVHEIGINKKNDKANICIANVEIGNMPWATNGKTVSLSIKILNKGLSAGKKISAKLSATRSTTEIMQGMCEYGNMDINEIKACQVPFSFRVQADSIEIAKFKLTLSDGDKNEWSEFFEIPMKKAVPEIKDFEIADGKMVTVVKSGIDSETIRLGHGNGDGVANPGESIVLLVKDQDKNWRTDLCFSDKYINPFGINIRKTDDWDPIYHYASSTKYNVALISSDCPENHEVDFLAEYCVSDEPLHIFKQGIIKINVKGKDTTSPQISWVRIPGDNVVHVKVYDGSKIQSVKAKFILKENPKKSFEVVLKDNGLDGDQIEGDNVFSKRIPDQKFGIYRVVTEATDWYGNSLVEECPDTFVLH